MKYFYNRCTGFIQKFYTQLKVEMYTCILLNFICLAVDSGWWWVCVTY